ncbi:hypothetical protein HMN09_00458700 [Mycena chlorophos]|uniref:Uncharacterized protein n=1 Tax=Mycena chlorophos TaxID=658473 RepID=A0A8H6WHQ0_MYCCL|nr:hypothetical protein HMN09_00458700 [Mycena chlorophos]
MALDQQRMPLRPPADLHDGRPLSSAPFDALFRSEPCPASNGTAKLRRPFINKVADAVAQVDGYETAVDAFYELAFERIDAFAHDDPAENGSTENISRKTLLAFVVFYWCMHHAQSAATFLSLSIYCPRGCRYRGPTTPIEPRDATYYIETSPATVSETDLQSDSCDSPTAPEVDDVLLSGPGEKPCAADNMARRSSPCPPRLDDQQETGAVLMTPLKRKLDPRLDPPQKRRRTLSCSVDPEDLTQSPPVSPTGLKIRIPARSNALPSPSARAKGKMKEEPRICEPLPLLFVEPERKQAMRTNPPIWGKSRQEICETLEYFQSYQGGVYFTGGLAKGYLLGGFGAPRDRFLCDGKLIISHGGGKAESLCRTKGELSVKSAADQRKSDPSVAALLHNYRNGIPIVLLADDNYKRFPVSLKASGVYIAVLGYYRIVAAWAESILDNASQQRVIRWKFAFHWCENQDEPWWTKEEPARMSFPESSMRVNVDSDNENANVDAETMADSDDRRRRL